jgi:hypothetical protein
MDHQDLIKPDPDEYSEPLQAAAHWAAHWEDHQQGHFDNSSYHTPNMKRSRSDRSIPTTPDNGTRPKYYRRWPSEAETAESVPVSELPSESTEFDDDNDVSKLKGVRYPGMGLFDSADEIQKRMRNQRKHDSVLKQMEVTSSGIEPNEFVWAEDGEFQRIRDIYASPSIEGSPVSQDSCPLHHGLSCAWFDNLVLTFSCFRIESSRTAMPTDRSVAAVPRQRQHRAQHAHGAQLELPGRQLGTGVPSMTTRAESALRTATTSSVTRRSLVSVCRAYSRLVRHITDGFVAQTGSSRKESGYALLDHFLDSFPSDISQIRASPPPRSSVDERKQLDVIGNTEGRQTRPVHACPRRDCFLHVSTSGL